MPPRFLAVMALPFIAVSTLSAAPSRAPLKGAVEIPPILVELSDPSLFTKDIPADAPTYQTMESAMKTTRMAGLLRWTNESGQRLLQLCNGKPLENDIGPKGPVPPMGQGDTTSLDQHLFRLYGDAVVIAVCALDKQERITSAALRIVRFSNFTRDGKFFGVEWRIRASDLVPIDRLTKADVKFLAPFLNGTPLPARGNSKYDSPPQVISRAAPQYPYDMAQRGVSGEVLVDFVVDVNGRPTKVRVAKSSQPEFEAAAIFAVQKWRYKPATKDGQPVEAHLQVPVGFTYRRG